MTDARRLWGAAAPSPRCEALGLQHPPLAGAVRTGKAPARLTASSPGKGAIFSNMMESEIPPSKTQNAAKTLAMNTCLQNAAA